MRRAFWLPFTLLGFAAVIAATVGPAALAGSDAAGGVASAGLRGGAAQFVSVCRFSHRGPDDPIVSPGKPGLSHDHSFVGNRTTNAFSTLASLRAGATSCDRPGDKAAYWMPTLLADGKPVAPLSATIYYRRRTAGDVRPFPAGLKMVAGNSHATSPQNLRVTFWNCGAETRMPPSSTVPTCPDTRRASLRLHVTFPSCWNGTSLDSADHQSHMAYPDRAACPADHPVAVPALSVIFHYPVTGGPNVELSSLGQYSGHADFFNAWDERALTQLVNGCLNAQRHCGRR